MDSEKRSLTNENGAKPSDQELAKIAEIEDLDQAASAVGGGTVLILGAGDLVRKKLYWLKLLKRLGIDVYLADISPKPLALDELAPYIKDFFCIANKAAEDRTIEIGKKNRYRLVDISTWPDTHMHLAVRHQDFTHWIVDTKPVDMHLDQLGTIHRYMQENNPIVRQLADSLLVHDHYGGRWVLREAARHMPEWHGRNGFIDELQIYILESRSVNQEESRLEALKHGICLDLMPHAFRVLESLVPRGGK